MVDKISRESAEAQFEIFCDYYDFDPETDIPEEDAQRAAFEATIEKVIKAIRKGRLEIIDGDPLQIIQHLKKPQGDISTIEYSELTGRHKLAMKDKKGTDNYGRCYALCGAMSGMGETAICKLKGADLSVVECLGLLFLQI